MISLGRPPVTEQRATHSPGIVLAIGLVVVSAAAALSLPFALAPALLVVALPGIAYLSKQSVGDEVTVMAAFTLLLFAIPARLVLGALGSVGTPAMMFSLGLGMLWVVGQMLPDQHLDHSPSPVRRVILLFTAANMLAYVAASLRATSGLERTAADRGALTIAAATGLTLFALDSIRSRSRLRLLLEFVVLGASVSALIGVVQFTTGLDLAARIRIPGLESQVSDLTFIAARSGFRRVAGTALHAIEFSVLLVMALPLALHFSRFGPRSRQRFHKGALLLIGLALPMSLSRTGVVGLVVVLMILVPTWDPAFRRRAAVRGLGFLVAVRLAFPGLLGTIRSLFTSFFVDSSINDRRTDYGFVADFIAQRPIFGRGFFTFIPNLYDFIDNQFLLSFVETGIIGLILYAAVWLTPIITCVGVGRSARWPGRPSAEAEESRDLAFTLAASIAVVPAASATFDFLSFSSARVLAFFLVGVAGAFWRLERSRQADQDHGTAARPQLMMEPVTSPSPSSNPVLGNPTDQDADEPEGEQSDLSGLGSGLRWSVINQLLLRIGTFGSGIVLARLLLPHDFGVYAAGLAVLKLLMAVNDLGVILGVVRFKGSPRLAAATAWTMSTGTSTTLFAGAFLSAPVLADAFGSPEATGVIRLMSIMVVIDGLAAIPSALLTRSFLQGRQAAAELVGLTANVVLSIVLAMGGHGAWSLAWGQLVGNATTLAVLLVLSDSLPMPRYDRGVARQLASFGVPLAVSTLVEQGVLNADYVIIGATLGTESLGLYMLAFNISSWPISIITFAVRRVSIVAFSKLTEQRDRMVDSFIHTLGVLLGAGALVAVLLSTLAGSVVDTVYGSKWAAAVTPLRLLAILGLARIAVMFMFDLLIGDGRSRTVLKLQTAWLLILVPTLLLGTHIDGTRGAATAHLVVTILLVLPMFTIALRPSGIDPLPVLKVAVRPVLATVPAAIAAAAAAATVDADPLKVLLGGTVGATVFLSTWAPGNRSLRWIAAQRREHTGASA